MARVLDSEARDLQMGTYMDASGSIKRLKIMNGIESIPEE